MTATTGTPAFDLDTAVIEDHEAGIYRANRSIFTDEELFELEIKHIFEGNWIYLAHESQVRNPGDYFTTTSVGNRSSSRATRRVSCTASSTRAHTAAR